MKAIIDRTSCYPSVIFLTRESAKSAKIKTTQNMNEAISWADNRAQNVIDNISNAYKGYRWEVVDYQECLMACRNKQISSLKSDTQKEEELIENARKIDNSVDVENFSVNSIYQTIRDSCLALTAYFRKLNAELNKYDLMCTDIEHKIENSSFSASQGYLLAKKLQEVRKERRKVKNEQEKCRLLLNKNFAQLRSHDLQMELDSVEKRTNYTPRILTELFE